MLTIQPYQVVTTWRSEETTRASQPLVTANDVAMSSTDL